MSIKKLNKGFTLIEILVVMVIILIVTTIAVLAIGDGGRDRRVKYTAENLIGLLDYAQMYAILTPAVLKFNLDRQEFGFQELFIQELKGKLTSIWKNTHNPFLKTRKLPSFMKAQLSNPVVITANGTSTAFTLTLKVDNENKIYEITGNAGGNYTMSLEHSS